jgi:hypothetical protein
MLSISSRGKEEAEIGSNPHAFAVRPVEQEDVHGEAAGTVPALDQSVFRLAVTTRVKIGLRSGKPGRREI